MATKNKIVAQKKIPKKYNRKTKTTVNKTQRITESITPPHPSASPKSGISKSKPSILGVLSTYFFILSICKICPTLSLSFKPKYNPELIKMKKAPAKIDVETTEF